MCSNEYTRNWLICLSARLWSSCWIYCSRQASHAYPKTVRQWSLLVLAPDRAQGAGESWTRPSWSSWWPLCRSWFTSQTRSASSPTSSCHSSPIGTSRCPRCSRYSAALRCRWRSSSTFGTSSSTRFAWVDSCRSSCASSPVASTNLQGTLRSALPLRPLLQPKCRC